jgi:hypothetical protein
MFFCNKEYSLENFETFFALKRRKTDKTRRAPKYKGRSYNSEL